MYRRWLIGLLLASVFYQSVLAASTYEDTKVEVERARKVLATEYKKEQSSEHQFSLLADAAKDLHKRIVHDLAPHWYGTKWDFYGTSQVPGTGSIACGYFVTTLLRDAGVKVQRVKLAQQASENIIKSLVSKKSIKRYSNKSLDYFLEDVKSWGNGLYIVGLDFHVGFISVEASGIYFVHSSFYEPSMVIRQLASESKNLLLSKYRVIGKLDDERFLKAWLSNAKIATVQ